MLEGCNYWVMLGISAISAGESVGDGGGVTVQAPLRVNCRGKPCGRRMNSQEAEGFLPSFLLAQAVQSLSAE